MISVSQLLSLFVISQYIFIITVSAAINTPVSIRSAIHEEPIEVGYHGSCDDNTTVCNVAESLECLNGICECENGSVWETGYHTCRPLSHQPPHPMSWPQIALIVGFSLTVLVLVTVFVVRKRWKESREQPTLEERRKSVFAEAKGDIPMKQRKFSQHFA